MQTINLNLVPGKVKPVVHSSQYDKGRTFRCYQGWRAHASKGNTYRIINRMDKFYKEVSENAQNRKTDTADQGPCCS